MVELDSEIASDSDREEYLRLATPHALTEDQFRNLVRSNARSLLALRDRAIREGMMLDDAPAVIAKFLTRALKFQPGMEQPTEVTIAWALLIQIVRLGTALSSQQINEMPPVALHRKTGQIAAETLAWHLHGVLENIAREELAIAAYTAAVMRDAA